ncbi:coatomer subunit gamma [Quercus suber]|uniref:Coatomer subunit gamma n=1 Tax=Quercus suber TaxID=58331 RepID=A0AAW0IP11_QUESU
MQKCAVKHSKYQLSIILISTVIVLSSEAEEFAEVLSKPIRSLPYDTLGQTFMAFEKPEGVPVVGKFSNICFINLCIWRYYLVDPTTGETEDDGVEDEYQLEDLEVVTIDYMLKVGVSNFKNAWESMVDDCFPCIILLLAGEIFSLLFFLGDGGES